MSGAFADGSGLHHTAYLDAKYIDCPRSKDLRLANCVDIHLQAESPEQLNRPLAIGRPRHASSQSNERESRHNNSSPLLPGFVEPNAAALAVMMSHEMVLLHPGLPYYGIKHNRGLQPNSQFYLLFHPVIWRMQSGYLQIQVRLLLV